MVLFPLPNCKKFYRIPSPASESNFNTKGPWSLVILLCLKTTYHCDFLFITLAMHPLYIYISDNGQHIRQIFQWPAIPDISRCLSDQLLLQLLFLFQNLIPSRCWVSELSAWVDSWKTSLQDDHPRPNWPEDAVSMSKNKMRGGRLKALKDCDVSNVVPVKTPKWDDLTMEWEDCYSNSYNWLVVTGTWMFFSIYWECHHPNCYSLHHFSEGLFYSTTNQLWIIPPFPSIPY